MIIYFSSTVESMSSVAGPSSAARTGGRSRRCALHQKAPARIKALPAASQIAQARSILLRLSIIERRNVTQNPSPRDAKKRTASRPRLAARSIALAA